MKTIRLELTPDQAHHLVGALFVASDANSGNENTSPDGRSWEEFTRAVAVQVREAALAAELVSAEEEYSLVDPIIPGPIPPDLPAPPVIFDQSLINKAYRKARQAGDDHDNAIARVLLDLRVSKEQALQAAHAYGDESADEGDDSED